MISCRRARLLRVVDGAGAGLLAAEVTVAVAVAVAGVGPAPLTVACPSVGVAKGRWPRELILTNESKPRPGVDFSSGVLSASGVTGERGALRPPAMRGTALAGSGGGTCDACDCCGAAKSPMRGRSVARSETHAHTQTEINKIGDVPMRLASGAMNDGACTHR